MKDESRQPGANHIVLFFLTILAAFLSAMLCVTINNQSIVRAAENARVPAGPATTRPASQPANADGGKAALPGGRIADPKQVGGEAESIVQIANLVYAGTKSSKCFSDHFLAQAEKASAISTSRRFHAVKLSSSEVFGFPMVIMTGEGDFALPDGERENLRKFVDRGGFLLALAGCSSREWDRSFRNEMARIFPAAPLQTIDMQHPVFHTVTDIKTLNAKHGKPRPLEGVHVGGRLAVLYSQDGLNDTEHTQGCCCCGGNEITNAVDVNVNVLAYALTH